MNFQLFVIVEWRLIPVEKHFKFHYVDDEEIKLVIWDYDHVHVYQMFS